MDFPASFRSPDLARRYVFEGLLGHGGMAVVVLATDQELGRRVAIKFRTAGVEDPGLQAEARFEEEARIAGLLKHAHIVPLLSAGKDGDRDYLIFEYVPGETLATRLARDGALPVGEALRILDEVLAGLQHAHGAGITHRDLKPSNLMLRETDGGVQIMDFGVARRHAARSFKTEPGTIVGTPAYMAPEQIREQVVTPASDVFALGVVAFEVLAGTRPLEVTGDAELFRRLLSSDPLPTLHSLDPRLPADLSRWVAGALEKDRAHRFRDAGEARAALHPILVRMGAVHEARTMDGAPALSRRGAPRPDPTRVSVVVPPPPSTSRVTAITSLVALVTAALVLATLLGRRTSTGRPPPTIPAADKVLATYTNRNTWRLSLLDAGWRSAKLVGAAGANAAGTIVRPFEDGTTLDVDLPPEARWSSARVEAEDAEGQRVRCELTPPRGIAWRLVERLDRFDPVPFITRMVSDRRFVVAESYEDHTTVVNLSGSFTKSLRDQLVDRPFWADLVHWRRLAGRWSGKAPLPVDVAQALHGSFRRLRQLDLALIFQRNRVLFDVPALERPWLETTFLIPAAEMDPNQIHVTRAPTCWAAADHSRPLDIDFFSLLAPVTAMVLSDPYAPAGSPARRAPRRATRMDHKPSRSYSVEVPPAGPGRRLRIRSIVTFLGPAYFFEIRLTNREGREAMRLHLDHAGTRDWYLAMDGAYGAPWVVANGKPVPYVTEQDRAVLTWCEIRHELDAALLPPGPYQVLITYHHLPGHADWWGRHHRLAYLQRMTIEPE